MSERATKYAWACGLLQKAMEEGMHGNITISMHNGLISSSKTEVFEKPPVDNNWSKT